MSQANYDLYLLKEADKHLNPEPPSIEELSSKEMLQEIADKHNIDTKEWFGNYLLLQLILNSMEPKEANQFLLDTFDVLEDEIKELYEREGLYEQIA